MLNQPTFNGVQLPVSREARSSCLPNAGVSQPERRPFPMQLPKFETNALATIERVTSTFTERGTQYGDTMANCQWLSMKSIRDKFNLSIPDEFLRALAIAGLCDIKYQRQEGGYKDDSSIDAIAYQCYLAEEVREIEALKDVRTVEKGITNYGTINGTPVTRAS